MNPKAGCAGSILNMLEMHEFNHQVKVERGVLKEECSEMLSAFFRRLRVVKKKNKRRGSIGMGCCLRKIICLSKLHFRIFP